MTTTTNCPIWCELFTAGQHKHLHGAHKASYAGATAQVAAALVHHPGAGELTVEITVSSPSGGEQVTEMTAMAAADLAEALMALTAELARIGSSAALAWPSHDQQNNDRTDHNDGQQMPPGPAADAGPGDRWPPQDRPAGAHLPRVRQSRFRLRGSLGRLRDQGSAVAAREGPERG